MQVCVYKPNKHQGFCSVVNCILCLIDYCLKHRMIPEVDLSECQYNTRLEHNFFNVFFEIQPLFGTETGGPAKKTTFTIDSSRLPAILKEDPEFEFPVLMFNNFPETPEARHRIHELTTYLKVNSEILSEVDSFWQKNCTGPTIGIHIRGTDYNLYEFAHILGKPDLKWDLDKYSPRIEDYALPAKKFLEENPDGKVLLATDSERAYKAIRFFSFLRHRIVRYPSTFLVEGRHPHKRIINAGGNGERMAKEILTEVLLLSRCKRLISSYGNVSALVIALNPEMDHENVSSWIKSSDGGTGRRVSLRG